jgi:hypothetical protein
MIAPLSKGIVKLKALQRKILDKLKEELYKSFSIEI